MKGMQKIKRGSGFRGVLDYALTHEGQEPGELIGGNMSGTDARELAAEFGAVRQLRPDIEKPVWHNSLRLPEGETLTPEKWAQIADDYMQRMGFTDAHQRAYILHDDPAHLHIVANRIAADGSIYYGRNENLESTRQIQALERDHGLTITKGPEYDPEGRVTAPGMRRPTAAEINATARTGEPSARMQLQELALAAQRDCRSYTEYSQRLDAVGVELVPVLQKGGAHMSGLSYRLDQVQIKGSDLGSRFTAAGIKKEGISYEQDRDGATARADAERAAHRAFGITDAAAQGLEDSERGRTRADDRAAGPVNRGTDGRDARDAEHDRRTQQERSRRDSAGAQAAARSDQRGENRSDRDAARSGSGESKDVRNRVADRSIFSGSSDRVAALSGQINTRTAQAVERQTAALGAERYEVGIRDAKSGNMMNRTFTGDELKKSLPWLQRQNAKGEDIYIRPAGDTGVILVDDLKKDAIEQMKAKGFAPAAVVETSPGNYQAWVKISDQPQPLEVRRTAAQALAKAFGGDMNSADGQHYGRLAGFTNRKPQYERDGRSPFVLSHPSPGAVAEAGPRVAEKIAQRLEAERNEQHQRQRLDAIRRENIAPGVVHYRAADAYRAEYAVLLKRYGENMDASKADYMIAKSMAKRGFGPDYIAGAIRTESPCIETRKAGHADDYAARTVAAAERSDDVRAARRDERDNDRGLSM